MNQSNLFLLPFVIGMLSRTAPHAPAADVPPRSEAGQTLVPTTADLDKGEIYHIYTGEDAQLIATSDALLQRTIVTCRRAVGYFVVPFDRSPGEAPISSAFLRIPAAALETGNTSHNALLRGPLLDAEKNPEIEIALTEKRDVKKTSQEGEPETYSLTLGASIRVKGKTLEISAPATVTLLPFTFRTLARYPGDILTLRTALDLKIADLGLEKPGREWADKIADSIHIDLFLLANTVSPEKSLDPAIKQPHNLRHLKFLTLLRDFDDPAGAYAFARPYMNDVWDEAAPLNRLAFDIVAEDGVHSRDFGFALAAAKRACELTKHADASMLDTLARVHFERGELDEAIRVQKIAVEKAATLPPPASQPIHEALGRYEKRRNG